MVDMSWMDNPVSLYYDGDKVIETNPRGYQIYWDEASLSASSTSYSSASSGISDSAIATEYAMKAYAERLADRMADDNLDSIDKNTIAGMIYAILMQDDEKKIEEFKDEDFLL